MTRRQVRILCWLAILVCTGIVLAAVMFDAAHVRTLLAIAGAGIVAATVWNALAQRRLLRKWKERHEERLQELKRQLELIGTPIVISGSSGLSLALVLGIVAAVVGWFAWIDRAVLLFVLAGFLAILFAFLVLMALPGIGKPLITLHRHGIELPAYGLLKWDEIAGMDMRTQTVKGTKTYFLEAYVPGLPERQDRMHPAFRFLYQMRRGKCSVHVRLFDASESPQLIGDLCRALWTASTGRTARWNARMGRAPVG